MAFDHGKVFLSETNAASIGDPVIQQLDNGNHPDGALQTTSILRNGDTGTNLLTGQVNQPLPVSDTDSLKVLSDGSLILTSGNDASLTIVSDPGTAQQSASFLTLPNSASLDDVVVPTTSSGTFLVANQNANDVLQVKVTGLNTHDIYASLDSANAVVQIDPKTGAVTPIITGLNSPHGLAFLPASTPAEAGVSALQAFNSLANSAVSQGAASGSANKGGSQGGSYATLPQTGSASAGSILLDQTQHAAMPGAITLRQA